MSGMSMSSFVSLCYGLTGAFDLVQLGSVDMHLLQDTDNQYSVLSVEWIDTL